MKKVVFLGNCQATRLYVLYNEQFQPVTGDSTELVVNFVDLNERGRRAMEVADVIVAQAMDGEQVVSVDKINTKARIVEFPLVTGLFLWPFFSGHPRIHNTPLPHLSDGPFGQQFGDRWLDKKIIAGGDPDDIVAEYEALDVAKVTNLDRLYDLVMMRARQRDQRTGFSIAPLIEKTFRDRRLFMSPANPELEVFRPLAVGVYEQLGISSSAINAMLDTLWRSPFPIADHPIHPSVARHFGLDFIGSDARYRTLSGERVTFREWVSRYVHYRWNDTLLEGAYKASRMRQFDGEAAAALDQIDAGLAQSEGSAYGETSRAHLLKLKGDHAGALAATRRACEFDNTNPQIVGTLVIYLAEAGDLGEAERAARHLTANWPHYADGWHRLGVILERRGRLAEAAEAVAEAVRLAPREAHYHKHLAAILVRSGEKERARDVLAGAIATMPDKTELHLDLSRLLAELGDFDTALVTARNAVKLDEANASLKAHLADILTRRGDYVAANSVLREAIAAAPNQLSLLNARAELLRQLGRHDEANAEIRRAIALEPGNVGLCHAFAQSLIAQGALAEAVQVLGEALAMAPANEALQAGLTSVLSRQGRFDEAEAIARAGVVLSPERASFHRMLADVLQAAGKFAEAEPPFRAAIALAPDDDDLRGSLALNLHRQGKLLHAMRVIEEAVSSSPNNPHLLAKQCFLYRENGDLTRAKAIAETAISLAPHLAGLHATLGDVYEREGDLAAAVSAYRSAVRLDSANAHYLRQAERLGRLTMIAQSQAAE